MTGKKRPHTQRASGKRRSHGKEGYSGKDARPRGESEQADKTAQTGIAKPSSISELSQHEASNFSKRRLRAIAITKRRFTTRKLVLGLLMLFLLFGGVWGFFFFNQTVPAEIRAKFSQLGDIKFSYDKYQVEAISPLCGCYRETPAELWRGITFAARYLRIERQGGAPSTQYIITAPEPTNTFWTNSGFRIGATLYVINLPEAAQFDPRVLVHGELPETYSLMLKQQLPPQPFYLIFSQNQMNVAMLGDKPLGAWVPSEASDVTLKYEKKMSLAAPVEATLEEDYKANTLSDEQLELQQVEMGLPLGDFLGPNVIFWWDTNTSSIVSPKEMIPVSILHEAGKKTVIATVINPPFSVRVALNSASAGEVEAIFKYSKKYFDNGYTAYSPRGEGRVLLTIKNPEDQVADFNEIYNRLKRNELTLAYNIPTDDASKYPTGAVDMQFRYPPIPPNNGFNIFGPIRDLKLQSSVGSVLIGSRQYDINAPSELEMRNVESLKVDGGVIPVPLQVSRLTSSQPELQLQARSEIFVNHESRNHRADQYQFGEYFGILSIIISFASGVVSLWTFARGYKRH